MHTPARPSPFICFACGTQHLAVQLVDPRSSAAAQSLVSPSQIGGSTSGSADGAVRIWDVKRSTALIGLLG